MIKKQEIRDSLTEVKNLNCFRTQHPQMFGAYRKMPYLCIVKQKKLGDKRKMSFAR